MNPLDIVNELCRFPHRIAGSVNEQKAAKIISAKLESLGLNPHTERFKWPPSYSWSLIFHFGLLFASEIALIRGYALIGALLALATAVSLWGEVSGRFMLIGRLVPRIESRNVLARFGAPEPMKRLVVVAHIDTAKSGMIFHPYITKFLWENTRTGVLTIPFFASMLLAAVIITRALGAAGLVTDALSLLSNLIVGISALLLVEREVSGEPICGANDNASGIAAALGAAQKLKGKPLKRVEIVLAFTGAGEVNAGGMQSLLKSHPEFASSETYIVNLDSVGLSPLKVSFIEGPVLGKPVPPEPVCLALTAAKGKEINLAPGRIRFTSDIYPALIRNAKATTIFGEEADFVRRSPKDRPENLSEQDLLNATQLIYDVANLLERNA